MQAAPTLSKVPEPTVSRQEMSPLGSQPEDAQPTRIGIILTQPPVQFCSHAEVARTEEQTFSLYFITEAMQVQYIENSKVR